MSDTTSLFSLHNVLCPIFQLPSTQKKAFHQCTQLGKCVTAVHDGLRMIECVIFTMWTGGWSKSRWSWDIPSPSESPAVQSDTGQVYLVGGSPDSWDSPEGQYTALDLNWAFWRCVAASSPLWPWRGSFHADWRMWAGCRGSGLAEGIPGGSPWSHIALGTAPGGWLKLSAAELGGAQD